MPRIAVVLVLCLWVCSCTGMSSLVGPDPDVAQGGQDYSLRLPPKWSVKDRGARGGASGREAVLTLVHADAVQSAKGYPTMMVREVREATPVGLFELMAKDNGLEFAELWSVGKDKYQLRQAQADEKGRVLSYWLSPRDGQGVEYYGAMMLAPWGRLELIGLAQAGTAQKYAPDFNQVITAVVFESKAQPTASRPGDLAAYLGRIYAKAIERERQGLARQALELASYAASAAGLAPQDKGMLQTTFAKAQTHCQEAASGLEAQMAQSGVSLRTPEESAAWQTQVERLDASLTAIETVGLNLRDQGAKAMVEKAAVRARKLVALGHEVQRLRQ